MYSTKEDETRYYELLGECERYCPKSFWRLLIYLVEDDGQSCSAVSARALLVENEFLAARQRYLLRQVVKFYPATISARAV